MGADLTTWSRNHYRVSFGRGLLLFFGAHPYRCERCRCNFVSFRKRKRKRVSRRSQGAKSTPSAVDGSEPVGTQTDTHED